MYYSFGFAHQLHCATLFTKLRRQRFEWRATIRPEIVKAVGFKEHVLSVTPFWKGVDKELWSHDVSINLKV